MVLKTRFSSFLSQTVIPLKHTGHASRSLSTLVNSPRIRITQLRLRDGSALSVFGTTRQSSSSLRVGGPGPGEENEEAALKAEEGKQEADRRLGGRGNVEDLARAQSVQWHRGNSEKLPPYQYRTIISGKNGKLLSTPSRLLKLLLPLRPKSDGLSTTSSTEEPLALLIHPHQPLSYLERLIQAEIPPLEESGITRPPEILFLAPETVDGEATDKMVRWTASTEVGDFVRDSSKGKEFTIQIEGGEQVRVSVPTFADRTRFLRHRLRTISYEIVHKGQLKEECDRLAHRSVQRVALGGFAGLVSWWGTVCVLTFQTSWGWDVMEPVTYLAGLTTVILGYCWFLYHNREVSYHSVLHLTVSKRQIKLYALKGFDLNQWQELLDDGKALRREIKAVAQEYDEKWDESNDEISSDIVKKALDGDGKKGKEDDSDESRSD